MKENKKIEVMESVLSPNMLVIGLVHLYTLLIGFHGYEKWAMLVHIMAVEFGTSLLCTYNDKTGVLFLEYCYILFRG